MIKANNAYLISYLGIQSLIPITNGSLDFSGIPSPGRQILEGVVAQWVADGNTLDLSVTPEPEPDPVADWDGFLQGFIFPGNELYTGIATPVQNSSPVTQEHWQNLRTMIMLASNLRTKEALAASWNYLKYLCATDENPLSTETVEAFEALAIQFHIMDPV